MSEFSFCHGTPALVGQDILIVEDAWSQIRNLYYSSGRVISPTQRLQPNNTQHSQQTDIHALGGIRNYNLCRQAAANLHLRPRGHWDRQRLLTQSNNFSYFHHAGIKAKCCGVIGHIQRMRTGKVRVSGIPVLPQWFLQNHIRRFQEIA